jgi:DNA-3-methyladenine glycosylase II
MRSIQYKKVDSQLLAQLPVPERHLFFRDQILAQLIASQEINWPSHPTEDPIWGLLRIVIAQQISTRVACRIAERIKGAHPRLGRPTSHEAPDASAFRALGLSQRRAECCVNIVAKSDEIRARVKDGQTWEEALSGIKGIGPWTISVFRIMVLRDPDVLPMGDVGLLRAVANIYGPDADVETLGELWRPFRSVACWYLWKTLGNEQLG